MNKPTTSLVKKPTEKERYWLRRNNTITVSVGDPALIGATIVETNEKKKTVTIRRPLRGGGDPVKPTFIPKGEKIVIGKQDDGTEIEYPNALGSHMMRTGKGFIYVNRKRARQN